MIWSIGYFVVGVGMGWALAWFVVQRHLIAPLEHCLALAERDLRNQGKRVKFELPPPVKPLSLTEACIRALAKPRSASQTTAGQCKSADPVQHPWGGAF